MSEQSSRQATGALTSPAEIVQPGREAIRFKDRRDAGKRLGDALECLREEGPVVVAIPRGGVPVGVEVARALGAPLDVAVVRKIGAPRNPEYALGALAEGGVHVISDPVARSVGLADHDLKALLARVQDELAQRLLLYRGGRAPLDVAGRSTILVDDGLATGRSATAAMRSLRRRGAARVILAVPVASPMAAQALREEADEVVCLQAPAELWAVGQWYEDFRPPGDGEVAALLDTGAERSAQRTDAPQALVRQVTIPLAGNLSLGGELSIPASARGVVAFAHGSGSSRLSPRNREVAQALDQAGFATLLFDLLTPGEERDRTNVFDIPLLASRLVTASIWLRGRPEVAGLPLAYFGASTGAAAALTAAAELTEEVRAVISRGGRPDLARNLGAVRAPTLLIVGGDDEQVLALNREAQRQLRCPNELAIIPGATHLFTEARSSR
jgi:putative phosphoribosyl transferase